MACAQMLFLCSKNEVEARSVICAALSVFFSITLLSDEAACQRAPFNYNL